MEWKVISVYSRSQAIADGVLVDISKTAREAGIRYPVAITAAVYAECVKVPPRVRCQDEAGRLWDIVWMLFLAIRRSNPGESVIKFGVRVRNSNRGGIPPLVNLRAVCGPGDAGEPVITVMMPDED